MREYEPRAINRTRALVICHVPQKRQRPSRSGSNATFHLLMVPQPKQFARLCA